MSSKELVESITQAIVKMEGGEMPSSVNQALVKRYGVWNVGHLIWANQRGAKAYLLGRLWAGWPTREESVDGVRRQVKLDINNGHTLKSLISKYAPSSENKTDTYIKFVSAQAGIDPNIQLKELIDGE